jgi:N-sulfoglucosamine sulfohydrolase
MQGRSQVATRGYFPAFNLSPSVLMNGHICSAPAAVAVYRRQPLPMAGALAVFVAGADRAVMLRAGRERRSRLRIGLAPTKRRCDASDAGPRIRLSLRRRSDIPFMKSMLAPLVRVLPFLAMLTVFSAAAERPRPNVIWIFADDAGLAFGCYGQPQVKTPNVDRLAAEGRRYTHCFTTSPVCSPSRSALFTGRYQTTINSHNHRTANPQPLPAGVKTITDHFRAAGYFTVNLAPAAGAGREGNPQALAASGKTDLNFAIERPYDGRDWKQRQPGQPFFAHVNMQAPHRGAPWLAARNRPDHFDRATLNLPAYYPDHPVVIDDYVNYLKAIELFDQHVGELRARLEAEGLLENSILVVMGDNGECLFRSKQFLYDGGLRVPLIIRWPDRRHAGTVDHQLISGIDVTAAVLALAGLRPDAGMHGRNFLNAAAVPRDHIIAARDRMGLGSDRMRAVRTARYKYIRNYLPGIPYMQINPYKERSYPPWNLIKQLGREQKLTPEAALFAAESKPFEELYDLENDPDELRNLARDPAHVVALRDLRAKLDRWLAEHPDQGAVMEEPLDVLRVNAGTARQAGVTPLE